MLSENIFGIAHTACGHYGRNVEGTQEKYELLVEGEKKKFFVGAYDWDRTDCQRCLKHKRN